MVDFVVKGEGDLDEAEKFLWIVLELWPMRDKISFPSEVLQTLLGNR